MSSIVTEQSVCAGMYCVRFEACVVAVAKSKCINCSPTCAVAANVASKIVEQLRGPPEQRLALRTVAQIAALAVEGKDSEDIGLCALVLVAVEPVTSGGVTWAYAFSGRGPVAAFQSDFAQRVLLDVVPRAERSPASGSPASSSPVSSTNSTSSSPRASAMPAESVRVNSGADDAACGACLPGQLFLLIAEPIVVAQYGGQQTTKFSSGPMPKPTALSPRWKRASTSMFSSGETVRGASRSVLAECADWKDPSQMEHALVAGIRSKRPDALVAVVCVPVAVAAAASHPHLDGTLFGEQEHTPLGVMVLHSASKGTVTLFVRTIPFGSLECTPTQNHVSMYLSRREDQLGQSHVTKWEKNVRKTMDELSEANFVRVVMLPCKVDPSSQSIRVLDNGIVRIDYAARDSSLAASHTQSPPPPVPHVKSKGIGSVKRSIFKKKE